ncbi:MAG: SDR family NAD(P)-dependent oxidoreductase [Acetobacteraceae bacterium]|nr:SDR family NAD(P)-dependent oxidoreductase [Acetobacteraceae bacterium]MDW8399789.1 SDR family NAD(P)-dependent oxidoreductase [Acetobacteraceae bacterium]
MSGFRRIVVSGASRGLGAAMARRLSGPGVSLLLLGRDGAALARVATACAEAGATAETFAADLAAEREAIAARILAFDDEAPCDAVIANAGLAFGTAPDGTPESWRQSALQAEVNLIGAMAVAGPLLPRFAARRAGAVLLVASVAAFRGPVDTPGYAASKAGLRVWGEALRAALSPSGVRVTVACPGFFESRMSAAWRGPRPLLMPADRAAELILRGFRRGAARVDVPLALALLLRLLDLLPPALGDRALRLFRTRIAPP